MSEIARFKAMRHSDYWVDYAVEHGGGSTVRPAKMYGERLRAQGFAINVAMHLYRTSAYVGDDEGFVSGYGT